MFTTPVLFLIFNRPVTTKVVFEEIRKIKPKYLYIAADGPRAGKVDDDKRCAVVREIVLTNIDWECEVKTLLREENLGCGRAVSEAITWFFDNVEEGIILEDDCLPDPSFFEFCSHLLKRYRNEEKIMHIGGSNFQFGVIRGDGDYYFSTISHVWGWATWKRAWCTYQFDLKKISDLSDLTYNFIFNNNQSFINYYKQVFAKMRDNGIDTWDYQWFYAIHASNGLSICPNVNLIKNIGFRSDGTHTLYEPIWNKKYIAKHISSFKQPSKIIIDYDADAYTLREITGIAIDKSSKDNDNYKDPLKQKYRIIKGRILSWLNRTVNKIALLRRTNHQKVFSKIYTKKTWGHQKSENPFYSGTGSDDEYTDNYAAIIKKFIHENQVKSMIDLGCGDFRVGHKILRETKIEYIGVDVVPELINYNHSNFSENKTKFKCLNIVNDHLPSAELCTIRQVLQHLSNRDIRKVLEKCKRYKYLIVTEHLPGVESLRPNVDKQSDENIRLMYNSGVYLDKDPFNLDVQELLTVYPKIERGSKIVTLQVWMNKSF